MEAILIISNLVLVGLTGTYAWLTNKNVKQIQQESAYYRSVVEKQLRFTALPHLYWDLRPDLSPAEIPSETPSEGAIDRLPAGRFAAGRFAPDRLAPDRSASDRLVPETPAADQLVTDRPLQSSRLSNGFAGSTTGLLLEVFNISNVPAYDVHVSLIGAYTEEGMGIATFMRTYVHPRHRKFPLQPDKVGYYGVRNALRLSLLPTQQKIVLTLPFPTRPVDVYTLVQYREISGENHYQVCCFSAIDESGTYRANILEPTEIQSIERLHLFDLEDFALPEDGKDEFPYYLADFIDLWNHSISSRLIADIPAISEEEVSVKATYDF